MKTDIQIWVEDVLESLDGLGCARSRPKESYQDGLHHAKLQIERLWLVYKMGNRGDYVEMDTLNEAIYAISLLMENQNAEDQ